MMRRVGLVRIKQDWINTLVTKFICNVVVIILINSYPYHEYNEIQKLSKTYTPIFVFETKFS